MTEAVAEGVKEVTGTKVDIRRVPVTEIFADPTCLDVLIPANGVFSHLVEKGHAAFAYVFEGKGMFGAGGRQKGEMVTHTRLNVRAKI